MPLLNEVAAPLHLVREVSEALARGATILAPTQRAARSLRTGFDRDARERGETLWSLPSVFTLESWMSGLWTALLLAGKEKRLMLNRSQEHTVWRGILSADDEVTGLHSLDALAMLAAQAWERLLLYGGSARALAPAAGTPDTRAFARWATEFEHICSRQRLASQAELPAILMAALAAGTLDPGLAEITLVDFVHHPPAHKALFASLETAGYPVTEVATGRRDAEVALHTAHNDNEELQAAAQWLHDAHLDRPAARLGLVVLNMADRRAEIDRALADVFGCAVFGEQARPLFEFSLGQPLSDSAAGASALALLRWATGPIAIDAISGLLLSPFFGATDAALAAASAEFDAFDLRRAKLLRPQMTLAQCAHRMEQSNRHETLSPLLKRMHEGTRHLLNPQTAAPFADWADRFRTLLRALGWENATERDSLSFQARRRWESTLDELATLDFEDAPVSAATALDALAHLAAETVFAPESKDAPVQVLGPLELGGMLLDALWFLGADDAQWPMAAPSHPLLPWPVQQALGMPGVDGERDQAVAEKLTQSIAQSAAHVVFSFAERGEDEQRRPSPLLASLAPMPLQFLLVATADALPFEMWEDNNSLPPLPDEVVHGGARVLQLQAACSFRAFAELRLGSHEPEQLEQGFSARESGTVLHEVMQHFWGEAESQDNLRAMDASARNDLLARSIDMALASRVRLAHTAWDRTYLTVQRQRLIRLLEPWLEVELARPPFTVLAREQAVDEVAIGPLRLRLRVDRVDQTQGGPLILDYKSGLASAQDWEGERPDQPQLPLYGLLTQGEHLGGLAFAVLRAGKGLALEGFASGPDVLLKSKRMPFASMAEQVEDWRRILESLAYEFAAGSPRVAPKDFPKTCQHCGQRLLCRLDSSALQAEQAIENDLDTRDQEGVDG